MVSVVPLGWAELYPDMHHTGNTLAVHRLGVCVFTYIVCIYIRVVRVGEPSKTCTECHRAHERWERQAMLTLPDEMFFSWEEDLLVDPVQQPEELLRCLDCNMIKDAIRM